MNLSTWPHVVQQEKTAPPLHIGLDCAPKQRVRGLVLSAALCRGRCQSRTQGCSRLEESLSSRTESTCWLGSLLRRFVGSSHFPETTIWSTHVIFHRAVLLLIHPLSCSLEKESIRFMKIIVHLYILVCAWLYHWWKKHRFEQTIMQHIVGRGQCWNTVQKKEAEAQKRGLGQICRTL